MLRDERRLAIPSLGVCLLASCIAIGGGLLVTTSASAEPSGLLAQAGIDSIAPTPVVPRPAPPSAQPSAPPFSAPPFSAPIPSSHQRQRTPFTLHLHGGLFAPIDVNATSPTVGLRFGRLWLPHLQGGFLTGVTFRRKNLEQEVGSLPGLKPQLVLARLDGKLVPMMAFLQVNLTEKRFLVPYAGIAAGYEWLTATANDYRTQQKITSTYSNWAWESWGGFGMRLEKNLRFDAEIFWNGAKLERDVTDSSGITLIEAADMNGVGARVGLDILF